LHVQPKPWRHFRLKGKKKKKSAKDRFIPIPAKLVWKIKDRMNTIRIRLGHESLDVTLAYLKGKDAESEEAQEHANSSSLALYA
jgi:hypothetical protein